MYEDWTTRERNLRMSMSATLIRPPGRRQQWTARTGQDGAWEAQAKTEKEAADVLTFGLEAFLVYYKPPVVITYAGRVAVVSLDANSAMVNDGAMLVSWRIQTVRPDGSSTQVVTSAHSWSEAEAAARYSLAHDATDWHDDASVHAAVAFLAGDQRLFDAYSPTALKDYAAWQRAARHAINNGVEDYHAWAGEHAREFAVPEPNGATG